MANTLPFVVRAQITPQRGTGKRFEYIRSLEKIGYLINRDLQNNFSSGNMASPGGSGESGIAPGVLDNTTSGLSGLVSIVAVKPEFGQDPDMVTVVGFYQPNNYDSTMPPYGTRTVDFDGVPTTGPASGAPGWTTAMMPSTTEVTYVKALKAALEAAVVSTTWTILFIELNGVKWGRGGYHFPR